MNKKFTQDTINKMREGEGKKYFQSKFDEKTSKAGKMRGMLARKLKHGLKNLENARSKGNKTMDILRRHNEKE